MADYIVGICEDLCPKSETMLRTRQHLLHFFELRPGTKSPGKVIKSFSRSAAGNKLAQRSDLRTPKALKETVQYLLSIILLDKRKPFSFIYDFIFDRLRCVRQEIVIQNLNNEITIQLLEPMVLFLCFSRYRLCEDQLATFDPKICDQHVQECLKKVLRCYNEIDKIHTQIITDDMLKNRVIIESIYQVFNLGDPRSLQRGLEIPDYYRDTTFKLSFQASLDYANGNYYRVLKIMSKLPHIVCAIGSLKIQAIRRKLLQTFSLAYHSKNVSVSVVWLKKILCYGSVEEAIKDCRYYNIHFSDDMSCALFSKLDFNILKPIIPSRHENLIEQKLISIKISDVLLLKSV